MHAVDMLSKSVSLIRANPVLIAGPLVCLAILTALTVSLVGILLIPLLIPFLRGGLYGLARDANNGDSPSLSVFFTSGADVYLSLLGATFILVAIENGFGLLLELLMMVDPVDGPVMLDVGLLLLLVGLLGGYLVLSIFIQFFRVAIVSSGSSAMESFTQSAHLVHANLRDVLVYSLFRGILNGLVFLPVILGVGLIGIALLYEFSSGLILVILGVLLVGTVISTILVYTLRYTYHTVYYHSLHDQTPTRPAVEDVFRRPESESDSSSGEDRSATTR